MAEAWQKEQERLSRERWELMRMEATIAIKPHLTKKITPRALLPFPWDNEAKGRDKTPRPEEAEHLTKEQRNQRAAELLENLKFFAFSREHRIDGSNTDIDSDPDNSQNADDKQNTDYVGDNRHKRIHR